VLLEAAGDDWVGHQGIIPPLAAVPNFVMLEE
jgi:hypothetical protein